MVKTQTYLKTISNLNYSKNINFFQKVKKIFSGETSWNNLRSDLAVRWLSLISIKSKQVSKICSMVKGLSHPMHTGGSSPFNKKEWVIKEWPMCNRAITISSFLFVQGQTIHSFNTGNILHNYFLGTHPIQPATVLIYIYLCMVLGLRMGWAQPRCRHQGHP